MQNHSPEPWWWGHLKHRNDLETLEGGYWPFWEVCPGLSDNHDTRLFDNTVKPGSLVRNLDDCLASVLFGYSDDDGGRICISDENARLIAAAPDLLNACKAALYKPTVISNNPDGTIGVAINTEIRDLLLDAIHKAERTNQ